MEKKNKRLDRFCLKQCRYCKKKYIYDIKTFNVLSIETIFSLLNNYEREIKNEKT